MRTSSHRENGALAGFRSMPMPVGVSSNIGPKIMLYSGVELDLLDPSSSEFTIDDIAHGLSNICRYAGQCRMFYSVAEHSVLMSDLAGHLAFEALMHDAAEAFIGDITRPLKQLLPDYKNIERSVEEAIFNRFGLPLYIRAEIKSLDLQVLAAEQDQLMPQSTNRWAIEAGIRPANIQTQGWSPARAKIEFLKRYAELVHMS